MNNINKNEKIIQEKNKMPGIYYATTNCGLELPVLDITHPLFIKSINEEGLEDLIKESAKQVEMMKVMPDSQKGLFLEKSLIFGTYFYRDPNSRYLSGMSTYMLKLGPYLIGSGEERDIDRMISTGISSVAARMRLSDLCRIRQKLQFLNSRNPPEKSFAL
jgi:hypothetical protein